MDDGYKGSYTSYPKKMDWVEKPSFTFPGFGSGIDIHKQIGKLPKSKAGWNLPGHTSDDFNSWIPLSNLQDLSNQ